MKNVLRTLLHGKVDWALIGTAMICRARGRCYAGIVIAADEKYEAQNGSPDRHEPQWTEMVINLLDANYGLKDAEARMNRATRAEYMLAILAEDAA
jgi:hypothetical protein